MDTTESHGVPRRFGRVLLRTPKYLLLAGNLVRDDRLAPAQKAAAGACLGYAASPIDLMPGIIPVAGQMDDLTVLIGGLRTLVGVLPPPVAEEQLGRAGLTVQTMDDDLKTLKDTAWWLVKKGGAFLGRLTGAALGGAASRVQEVLRPANRHARSSGDEDDVAKSA